MRPDWYTREFIREMRKIRRIDNDPSWRKTVSPDCLPPVLLSNLAEELGCEVDDVAIIGRPERKYNCPKSVLIRGMAYNKSDPTAKKGDDVFTNRKYFAYIAEKGGPYDRS